MMGETETPEDGLEGFSPPVSFVPEEVKAADNEPGVHVVWSPDGEVLYVGQTADQRDRLLQHLSGDRESSVLHKKVGVRLDRELGSAASKTDIQSYLGGCKVSWRTSDDRAQLKADLIRRLEPTFNELIPTVRRPTSAQTPLHLVLRWSLTTEPQTVTYHREVAEAKGSVWWRKLGTGAGPSAQNFERIRAQLAADVPTFVFLRRPGEVWRTNLCQLERGTFVPDLGRVPNYYGEDDASLWLRLSDFVPLPADWPEHNLRFAQGKREGDPVDFAGQNSMTLVTTTAVGISTGAEDDELKESAPVGAEQPSSTDLSDLLRRVLELQPAWVSDSKAPAMVERAALVTARIPGRLRGDLEDGWQVAGSGGKGLAARIPWVRIFRPSYSPKATQGWYAVLLFAADGTGVYLSLNQGTQVAVMSQGRGAGFKSQPSDEVKARVRSATERLEGAGGIPEGSSPSIELNDPQGKGDDYETGNVFAFRYPASDLPSEEQFAAHLAATLAALDVLYGETKEVPVSDFDLELLRKHAKAPGRELDLPDEVLLAVLAALRSGKHIVLTGPPGTAKTTLAEAVADAAAEARLCDGYVLTTATSDWTTFETVGGLRPTEHALEFEPGQFVGAIQDNKWLVIDELNRANFDRAFGQLFTLLSGQAVSLPYNDASTGLPIKLAKAGTAGASDDASHVIVLPDAWRLLATMNVFDKSLLFEMSFALMRRFAFIEVDAPKDQVYHKLISAQLRDAPDEHGATVRAALESLLTLRSIKELGPALFIDMAAFARERLALGDVDGPNLTYQLFYSYLLPQFEGIDDGTARVLLKELSPALSGALRRRLRRDLQQVLGVELPSPVPVAIDDDGDLDDEDLDDEAQGDEGHDEL